jgi:hypothetical protein
MLAAVDRRNYKILLVRNYLLLQGWFEQRNVNARVPIVTTYTFLLASNPWILAYLPPLINNKAETDCCHY